MKPGFYKRQWPKIIIFSLMWLLISTSGWAAKDYYLYNNQDANDVITYDGVTAESWFVALSYLPATTSATLRGRMVAATGQKVFLQDAVDSKFWTQVATVNASMDASFIKVSPDGTTVALGQGWNKDLLVFPLSLLTSGGFPNLTTHPNTTTFSSSVVQYYDAAWADDSTHLIINGGTWDPVTQTASNVGISSLDTTNSANTPVDIISNTSYPGASSGVTVDASKNLIFGNGFSYGGGSLTGELVMLPAADWWDNSTQAPKTSGLPVAYSTADKFADSVLSAAHLGFDKEGNLHVGGGQFVSGGPNTENGYAVLISEQVISDTADSSVPLYQIDESDATQYREFEGDACRNDTATGVLSYERSIVVNWIDGSGACIIGGGTDWWGSGVTAKLTVFRVDTTRDGDNDLFADVIDNSPWTTFSDNTDTDSDGYGNYIDADFNNDGIVNDADRLIFLAALNNTSNMQCDLDGDGDVDPTDLARFNQLDGQTKPYYNAVF